LQLLPLTTEEQVMLPNQATAFIGIIVTPSSEAPATSKW
jgi:hypothetical protein